jgi:hypothetical protein
MLNYKYTLMGVSPPPLWLPKCDNPRTGKTSLSISARAVWGDRLMSPPSSYQHLEFHSKRKRNPTEPKKIFLCPLCPGEAPRRGSFVFRTIFTMRMWNESVHVFFSRTNFLLKNSTKSLYLTLLSHFFRIPCPAKKPVENAACRLYPPVSPSMSSTSPAK